MRDMCSMHCGHFFGVTKKTYDKEKAALNKIFESVRYDAEAQNLDLCGAREISDSPAVLSEILDRLSKLLIDDGKGQIMLRCEGLTEVCYFRKNKWKLVGIDLPADPFDGIRYVD